MNSYLAQIDLPCPPRHHTRPRSTPRRHSSHPHPRHRTDHHPRNLHHRIHPRRQEGCHLSSSV